MTCSHETLKVKITLKTTLFVRSAILSAIFALVFLPAPLFADIVNVPITGQTTSYLPGDDGSLQAGVSWPSPRFVDNGDGTISDSLTGLIWLKNANCFNVTLIWQTALDNGATLSDGDCGLTDGSIGGEWRMPNIRELDSLVHAGVVNPSVPNTLGSGKASNGNPFTNLQSNEYWSSTSNIESPALAFTINFLQGNRDITIKSGGRNSLYVRTGNIGSAAAMVYATGQTSCSNRSGTSLECTDTGQDGELQEGKIWPVPRFTDLGDGTVFDNLTKLTWLKNANCFGPTSWTNAVQRSNALADGSCGLTDGSLAGDWHLPNRNELSSLIDFGNHSPALADTAGTGNWSQGNPFSNVQTTSRYWTSTPLAGSAMPAWFVGMFRGISGTDGKQNIAYFWPVRGELEVTLTVEIEGSDNATVTSSPPGISCPGTCSFEFARDSIVTLTANSPGGTRFQGWSEQSCGTNQTCAVTMSASTTVTALFTEGLTPVSHWLLLLMD
jgi:hypothetical protein